jgi:hypothetical protein
VANHLRRRASKLKNETPADWAGHVYLVVGTATLRFVTYALLDKEPPV